MTQASNSTETIDKLPGMQEEDLRRKIPVALLINNWGNSYFQLIFDPDSMHTYRLEVAALRKAIKAYKQDHEGDSSARYNTTTGNHWDLHEDLINHFADWLEFQKPLEPLMTRAKEDGKERRKKEQEDPSRKIPVERVIVFDKYTRKEEKNIRILLAEDAQQTHRAELANIRWKLKGKADTKGTSWDLMPSALKQCEKYFEFQEPLDVLIERAKQELEERKRKAAEEWQTRKEKMREEALQYYQELRTRYVPNPSHIKVRVVYCECDEPIGVDYRLGQEETPVIHEIRIELDGEGTPQELEARKELAKLFDKDKKKYHIKGRGYNWRMDEYTLRAYLDWLILPCSLEEEIARWEREGERRPEYKIKIKNIYQSWMEQPGSDKYRVEFDYSEVDSILRKAIRTYRHKHQSSANGYYFRVDTSGYMWTLTEDILLYFESWFDLSEPMSTLLNKARKRAEGIRREKSNRYDFNPFSSFRRESEVESALQLFNLDRPVTQEDVKKKYRQLAKQFHPDTGGDAEKFKQLNQANQVLMQHFA